MSIYALNLRGYEYPNLSANGVFPAVTRGCTLTDELLLESSIFYNNLVFSLKLGGGYYPYPTPLNYISVNFQCFADEYEVKELCAQFTTNVVASCAFGINGGAIKDPESEFRRMGRAMIEPDFYQNIKIMIVFFVPWLANLFKLR